MPGIFKVPFSYIGTGLCDLYEVLAPAGNQLVNLGYTIYQTGTSDFGDAQEEGVELNLETGNTSGGSGGTAITPKSTSTDGGAANFTAYGTATTVASGATVTERGRWGWNVRMEKEKMFTEAEQIKVTAGTRAVFRMKTSSPDSLNIKGEGIWQEF